MEGSNCCTKRLRYFSTRTLTCGHEIRDNEGGLGWNFYERASTWCHCSHGMYCSEEKARGAELGSNLYRRASTGWHCLEESQEKDRLGRNCGRDALTCKHCLEEEDPIAGDNGITMQTILERTGAKASISVDRHSIRKTSCDEYRQLYDLLRQIQQQRSSSPTQTQQVEIQCLPGSIRPHSTASSLLHRRAH